MSSFEDSNEQSLVQQMTKLSNSFDLDNSKKEFEDIQNKYPLIHLQTPNEIITVIRKNKIYYKNLDKVIEYLKENKKSENKIFINQLCRIVKYSIQYGQNIEIKFLIDLLDLDEEYSKTEIVQAIGIQYDKNQQQIDEVILKSLEEKIKVNVDEEVKINILRKIRQKQYARQTKQHQQHHNIFQKRPISNQHLQKTRNQQQSNQSNSRTSQQSNIVIQGLKKALQSMNKNIQNPNQTHNSSNDKSKEGHDRVWHNGTYKDVHYIYSLAFTNCIIGDNDKDKYLPSKFLDSRKKMISHGILGYLVVDRMIAFTFQKISGSQKLNNYCIEKLIKSLNSLPEICKMIVGDIEKIKLHSLIKRKVLAIWIPKEPNNNIEYQLLENLKTIYSKYNCDLLQNKIKIKNKEYQNEINKDFKQLILDEVNKIRLDAATALFNCFRKNVLLLTENKQLIETIKKLQLDPNKEFNEKITLIIGTFLSSETIDQTALFNGHLNNLIVDAYNPTSFDFVLRKSMNSINVNVVFNEENILKMQNIILNREIDIEKRISYQKIINKVLEHPESQGLSLNSFENCIKILEQEILNQDRENLIEMILVCIFLTSEKQQHLSQTFIDYLLSKFNQFQEKFKYYTLIILGNVNNKFINNENIQIFISQINCEKVVIANESNIQFEEPQVLNKKNFTSISSIICKMLLNNTSDGIILKEQDISEILSVINNNDTQAKILASKIIFLYLNDQNISLFNDYHLIKIKSFSCDDVYDVHVYMVLTYTKCIMKKLEQHTQIEDDLVNYMSQLYSFKEKLLQEKDYSNEINTYIIEGFYLHSQKRGKFDQNSLDLLSYILFENHENMFYNKAIKIVSHYSQFERLSPNLVKALESLLDNNNDDDSELIQEIIENIIINHQFISQKVQTKYVENYFDLSSDKQHLSFKHSFQILNIIECQQGLTDENFEQLELQKAINCINQITDTDFDKAPILTSILNKTSQGVKIPKNIFNILNIYSDTKDVKQIILNAIENLQSIPQYLIDNLVNRFNPLQDEDLQISIFHSLSKNNQNISSLVSKVQEMLQNYSNFKHKLQIIYHLAQKGELIDEQILLNLINCFNNHTDSFYKQNLASIIFIVSSNMKTKMQKELILQIKNILILQINETNLPSMAKECLIGIKFLQSYDEVDSQITLTLFNLATSINLSKGIRMQILSILEKSKLSSEEQAIIEKFSSSNSWSEIKLYQISLYSKSKQLTSQHFKNLQYFIEKDINQNNEHHLSQKSLKILIDLERKDLIPEELIHSISQLLSSTEKESTIELCCELIGQIASQKLISEKVVYILLYLKNNQKVESTLKIIQQKQLLPQNQQITFLLQNIPQTINHQDLQKLLKEVITYQNDGFTINSSHAKQLIQILQIQQQTLSRKIMSSFADIFSGILQQNKIEFIKNNELVKNTILQSIRDNYISNNVVNGFRKLLILNLKEFDVISFMEEIFTYENYYVLNSSDQYQLLKIILVIFEEEEKRINVSQKCINILENNLQDCDELIQNISFKILSSKKGIYFNVLSSYQNQVFQKCQFFLLDNNGVDFSNLYAVYLLKNVNEIQINQIQGMSKEEQLTQLLLNELLYLMNSDENERKLLIKSWDICSSKLANYQKLKLLIHLIECKNEYQLDLKQIYQMLLVLRYFSFSYYIEQFSQNFPFESIIKRYIYSFIKQFVNKNKVESNELMMITNMLLKDLDFDFIYSLFQKIDQIEDINEIKSLIDFIKMNKVKPIHFSQSKKSIKNIIKSIQVKFIHMNLKEFEKKKNLKYQFYKLFDKGWSYQQLNQIIQLLNLESPMNILNNQRKYYQIFNIIHMINNFSIKPTQIESIVQLFKNQNIGEITLSLNKFCFNNQFSNVNEKNNILTDFLNQNSEIYENNIQDIEEKLKRIQTSVHDETIQNAFSKQISSFEEKDIQKWSKKIRKDLEFIKTDQFEVNAIQVAIRAYEIISNFQMKDSQILSCLVSLNKKKDKGRLLQVATGEGKSLIICILAIIYALRGHKVNIFTSSSVLAERDAKHNQKFFQMFGITCSHNNNDQKYIQGIRQCYKCDIVYGEISQFQFDTLRDEYKQLGTLAGRKCDIAIVDEVDSMLIDETSKIARLSSQIPGMDQFYIFYISIWKCLIKILSSLIHDENYFYLLNGIIEKNNEKLIFTYKEDGETYKIEDFEQFLLEEKSMERVSGLYEQIIQSEIEIKIKEKLKISISEQVKNKIIQVPSHFEQFVERQIPKWVESSLIAYQYEENINYIIEDGEIKPVDYFTSGQVLSSTNWSDGLHQFLQVKHNLKLTPETLTTNFLSNIGYLKRYKENVIGFTGTLGSEKAKEVMKLVYNVDFIYIPSIMIKKYHEYQPIIEQNEQDWVEQICLSALVEREKQRGVLIICESIHHATLVEKSLNTKIDSGNIKLYVINNSYQEVQIEKIYKGQIFVATNLAGRGTDINTSDIEENGGLHVIVTFIPQNQRVEEQAFGRTARQGNQGTGQLIINSQDQYLKDFKESFNELRDQKETKELDNLLKNQLQTINLKDEIFSKFCKELKQIRENVNKEIRSKKNVIKSVFCSYAFENQQYISAIEEVWALFIHKMETEKPNENNCPLSQLGNLIQNLQDKFEEQIKCPYYYISIANQLMIEEKYDESFEYYEKALQLNHNYSASALVGKAIIQIKYQMGQNYKKLALDNFEEALEKLKEEQLQLLMMQELLSDQDVESDLLKQIGQKISLFGTYVNSIESSKKQIVNSLRYIDIECVSEEGNVKQYFYEKDQTFSIIAQNNSSKQYNVTFNNLTRYKDTIIKDQALQTLSNSNKLVQNKKLIIQLNLKEVSTKKLENILNENIEIKACKKDDALNELEGKGWVNNHLVNDWFNKDNSIQLKTYDKDQEIDDCNINIQDGIKLIKNNSNDYQYNILKKGDNNIFKLFNDNAALDIEVLNIEEKKEFKDFFNLKASNIQMKLNGPFIKIQEALNIYNSPDMFVFTSETKLEKMNVLAFYEKYLQNNSDCLSVILSFERKYKEYCIQIIELGKFKNIDIIFQDIELSSEVINLPPELINVSIKNLDYSNTKGLINYLRDVQIDFSLSFNKLGKDVANKIIQHASASQEDILITSMKTIFQQFSELQYTSNQELLDLKNRGIEFFLNINEKGFVQATTISLLVMVSFLQIGVGALLGIAGGIGLCKSLFIFDIFSLNFVMKFLKQSCCINCPSSQSSSYLISLFQNEQYKNNLYNNIQKQIFYQIALAFEGLADLYTAYCVYRNRQFSWRKYAIQKTVSVGITGISLGIGSLIQKGTVAVKKVLSNATTGIGYKTAQGISKQELARMICQPDKIIELCKTLFSKKSTMIIKKGANLLVNKTIQLGLDVTIDQAINQIHPLIFQQTRQSFSYTFYASKLINLICKMQAIDKIKKKQELKQRIDKFIEIILERDLSQSIKQNCIPIAKQILASLANLKKSQQMGFNSSDLQNMVGVYDSSKTAEEFYLKIMKNLSKLDKDELSIQFLMLEICKIDLQKSKEICNELKNSYFILVDKEKSKDTYIYYQEYINPTIFGIDELKKVEKMTTLQRRSTTDKNQTKNVEISPFENILISSFQEEIDGPQKIVKVKKFIFQLNKEMYDIKKEELEQFIDLCSLRITDSYIANIRDYFNSPYKNISDDNIKKMVNNCIFEDDENEQEEYMNYRGCTFIYGESGQFNNTLSGQKNSVSDDLQNNKQSQNSKKNKSSYDDFVQFNHDGKSKITFLGEINLVESQIIEQFENDKSKKIQNIQGFEEYLDNNSGWLVEIGNNRQKQIFNRRLSNNYQKVYERFSTQGSYLQTNSIFSSQNITTEFINPNNIEHFNEACYFNELFGNQSDIFNMTKEQNNNIYQRNLIIQEEESRNNNEFQCMLTKIQNE